MANNNCTLNCRTNKSLRLFELSAEIYEVTKEWIIIICGDKFLLHSWNVFYNYLFMFLKPCKMSLIKRYPLHRP